MKNIKINLAKSAGFCFGVKRALNIAFETATSDKNVYMLGDIVHNEEVVRQIKEAGVKKIKRLSAVKDKILLIRAHGACMDTIKRASKLGYRIVDATCPMVKEIHKIARDMECKGYKVIIIGDKKHDEVHGIIGQLKNKVIVIDTAQKIPLNKIKAIKKAGIIVQSTQNLEKVTKIINSIKPYFKEFKFFNTICVPTRLKQAEIKKMPQENDVMIIIGSKTSANTKRLYEISRDSNRRTYWVNSKKEIKPGWFKGAKSVGVSAGASTPDSTTRDIVEHIRQISESLYFH